MKARHLALAALPLLAGLAPVPAAAVDNQLLEAACVEGMKATTDRCRCFVRVASEEMTLLQREVLLIQLSGRDREAASIMSPDARTRYADALERLTGRVQAECVPD